MQINRSNVNWAVRMAAIILAVGVADVLVMEFARRPFPWVVVIPALTPVLVGAFIIVPMLQAEKKKRLP